MRGVYIKTGNDVLHRVDDVYRVILRGCNDYSSLLSLLQFDNAPTDFEQFVGFMCNNFYVEDDFMAMRALIDNNIGCYCERSASEVLLHIFECVFNDYKGVVDQEKSC